MTNENEELKNLLAALNEKLVCLANYESSLINIGNDLKSLHIDMAIKINKIDRVSEKFDEWTSYILKTLDTYVADGVNSAIKELLEEYRINLTLMKGENND